jgi:uncharacterized membrane protein (UPF0182 family)
VSPDYGKLRLLELPRDTTVMGPGQMQNAFNSNTVAQNVLNLLRQGETDVKSGNLLTLPVGGGLLYVQPVYVQSSKGTQFPLLRKVFVAFGDSVGFADTLNEALDQVFGSQATTAGTTTPGTTNPGTTTPGTTTPGGDPAALAALRSALADAQAAIKDGQAALAAGDFAAYGDAQTRLQAALQAAVDADALLNPDGTGASAASGGSVVVPSGATAG